MKRLIFGGLLFALGSLGVIAMLAVSINPGMSASFAYNSFLTEGWFAIILTARALVPFILFCLMGITGLALCAMEAFRKEK